MTKHQFCILLVVAIIGGMLGGCLLRKIPSDNATIAQSDAQHKIIEANEFRIIDKNGNKLASFHAHLNDSGEYIASLTFRSGKHYCVINHGGVMIQEKGKFRSKLSSNSLNVGNLNKNNVISLGASPPKLTLVGDGKENLEMKLEIDGSPSMHFYDNFGLNRISVSVTKDDAFMAIFDKNEKPIWVAP